MGGQHNDIDADYDSYLVGKYPVIRWYIYIVAKNAQVLIVETSLWKYRQLTAYNPDGEGHLFIQSETKEMCRCKQETAVKIHCPEKCGFISLS